VRNDQGNLFTRGREGEFLFFFLGCRARCLTPHPIAAPMPSILTNPPYPLGSAACRRYVWEVSLGHSALGRSAVRALPMTRLWPMAPSRDHTGLIYKAPFHEMPSPERGYRNRRTRQTSGPAEHEMIT
jgi:hypothetical protein